MLKLLNDLAVALTECASGVCLIGIDMHSGHELGADTDNDVTENGASVSRVDLNRNDLLISHADSGSILGRDVNVALCNDNAAVKINLAAGSNELAAGSSRKVTALTNGCGNAESTCIGEGDLNLRCGTSRSENDNVRNRLLGADYGATLLTSVLTGLGKILFLGKGSALAEKCFNMLLGEMNVSCRGFNENLVCHFYVPHLNIF